MMLRMRREPAVSEPRTPPSHVGIRRVGTTRTATFSGQTGTGRSFTLALRRLRSCWPLHGWALRRDGKLDRLAGMPSLRSIPRRKLLLLAAICDDVPFPAGATLVQRGARATHCYVVLSGAFVLSPDGVQSLQRSNVIGAPHDLSGASYACTVLAASEVLTLAAPCSYLNAVLEILPPCLPSA